ncbi:hypothetical protein AHAS_Ahas13G0151100 [Arachis hypogaea]
MKSTYTTCNSNHNALTPFFISFLIPQPLRGPATQPPGSLSILSEPFPQRPPNPRPPRPPRGLPMALWEFLNAVKKGKAKRVKFSEDNSALQLTAVNDRRATIIISNDLDLSKDIFLSSLMGQYNFVSKWSNYSLKRSFIFFNWFLKYFLSKG